MLKVMLVDDEQLILDGLERVIPWAKYGCWVVGRALSGEEGIKLARELRPDMLITDICMGEMDGLTMIAALRSELAPLEVTVLTGHREFEYAQTAIQLGVARLLGKPSRMDDIEEAVACMVDRLKGTPALSTGVTGFPQSDGEASCFIVRVALAYIQAHFAQRLTLPEVADKVYVSQWHLSKLLNRHTGQRFADVLNRYRVEEGIRLLSDPSLRIHEISERVGFLDVAHFSKVFKKITGRSPNEYRNLI